MKTTYYAKTPGGVIHRTSARTYTHAVIGERTYHVGAGTFKAWVVFGWSSSQSLAEKTLRKMANVWGADASNLSIVETCTGLTVSEQKAGA